MLLHLTQKCYSPFSTFPLLLSIQEVEGEIGTAEASRQRWTAHQCVAQDDHVNGQALSMRRVIKFARDMES